MTMIMAGLQKNRAAFRAARRCFWFDCPLSVSEAPGGYSIVTDVLALSLPPLRDFALDRLGDVAPDELTDMIIDRLDQLGAGAGNDGLQVSRKLHFEPGIDEEIEMLQYLHRDLLGERTPAVLLIGCGHRQRCRVAGRLGRHRSNR